GRLRALSVSVPPEDQQARLADRSLGDAEQRAHSELLHCRAIEHLDVDPRTLERFLHARDEGLRIDDIRRLRDQLTSQRNAFDYRRPTLLVALFRLPMGADDHDLTQSRLLVVLELGPVAIVAPG